MIDLTIVIPQDCQIKQSIKPEGNDLCLRIELSFSQKKTYQKGAFFIGFQATNYETEKTFLMTHEQSVEQYVIPFAFPAFMGLFFNQERFGAWMVVDYYQTHPAFRMYHKTKQDQSVRYGLTNEIFSTGKDEVIVLNLIYQIYKTQAPRLTAMIQKCAKHVIYKQTIKSKSLTSYTTNIHNYEDAAYGVSKDLMDNRARIQDGVGTFIPYGYLETKPYSESFALMDVAKGMLPYALWLKQNQLKTLIFDELLKMTDESSPFPWIDDAHNTEGFFHLAWGNLPAGVTEAFIKKPALGLFSDVDGHEEGPNLLSTWKYYYRVEILGEMALLSNNAQIIKGFLRTLPFVGKLKLANYAQPVTYDLDTHLPATGDHDGGSAGGAALWSIIHLTAYDLTKKQTYLTMATNGLKHANQLDFDHYYSMRVAPKPVTVGWLTKANTYAYELTNDLTYLSSALQAAQAIYFFYYLSPHPYTYFSTMGYGYACSRERWEAFLEMVESLYSLSFLLKYNQDHTLLKLFWYARENWLWALPVNGNPYGNLDRPYDSIGGSYIPYEFSTGHMGDNPGLDGGSQSTMRQIKEIYGSGEVYLAYMMFEMNARVTNRNFLIVKSDRVNDLLNTTIHFILYNTQSERDTCVITFTNLHHSAYEIYQDQQFLGIFDVKRLELGIPFDVLGDTKIKLQLSPVDRDSQQLIVHPIDLGVEASGYENLNIHWQLSPLNGHTHYRIIVKNDFHIRTYDVIENRLNIIIDRELNHQIEVLSITPNVIGKNEIVPIPAQQRKILYRLKEDNQDALVYRHADLIDDGHLWMFYGHANQNQIDLSIKVQKMFTKTDILQLEIASLNDGCVYDVRVYHDANHYSLLTEKTDIEMIEIHVEALESPMIETINIVVHSEKGLGFALKRCDVISLSSDQSPMFHMMHHVKPQKREDIYFIETMINTASCEYIDINVDGLSQGANLKVYLNGIEAEMDIEKKYPKKKYREMNGVYRFRSNKNDATSLVVTSHTEKMRLLAMRLTNQSQYPKYAEYKLCKENDYDK